MPVPGSPVEPWVLCVPVVPVNGVAPCVVEWFPVKGLVEWVVLCVPVVPVNGVAPCVVE